MKKYFCDVCGFHFEHELSEKDKELLDLGLSPDLTCPHCGCYAVHELTKENAENSIKTLSKEECNQELWNEGTR